MSQITEESTERSGGRARSVIDFVRTVRNNKSVQEVSKRKRGKSVGRHAKTDVRYWEKAIFQPTYVRGGERRKVAEWSAKMQHLGRRSTFSLGTANRAAAAARAKEIYLGLQALGWDGVLGKYKPTSTPARAVTTVGDFLTEVKLKVSGRPKTVEDYCRAFRTIVADIFGIVGGKAKFDYRTGGRDKWVAAVHEVKLADVTPALVQQWKLIFLRRAGGNPLKQRTAKISVNSLLRQAKSLFAPRVLQFVALDGAISSPFAGVEFEPRQSMQYRSGFNVVEIIQAAQRELPCEQLKILLLAVMAGLRRNEIDKLEWDSFRWERSVIRIETTKFFQPKSEESAADVQIDSELLATFRTYKDRATGQFVIESQIQPKQPLTYAHYRCDRHFAALISWLRVHGVSSKTPLHSLRKEYGSQFCLKHGIYAASRALRHNDIAVTSQHYLDTKGHTTVGLGHLLTPVGRENRAAERTLDQE